MSSISGLAGTGLKFAGLASGVDTDKMIEGLLAIQTARVSTLQQRSDRFTLLQTTFKTLETQVLDLQNQATRLGRVANGAFDNRKVTVSDEALAKAAAGSSAAAGTYTFKVNNLAKAHQVASAGLTDSGTALKTGTLQIKVGDGATTTVTVDASNNTLPGLAAAINNSGADVAASVINDGTATPFRLLLTSKKTGQANDIEITNNLTGGNGVALDLDPATRTIQAGEDAQVVLGSGAGALTVYSASNKLDSLIAGVTIDLQAADPTKTVTLTVSNDVDGARTAIKDFVGTFNKIIDFIDERDGYDQQTRQAGTLLGSTAVADLQNELARALSSVVPGVNGLANRLSAIGLTFTDKGRLQIDDAKLGKALSGQISGVNFGDVRRLFALSGTSSNTNVSFLLATAKTKATGPVEVNITQAADQARLTAANALAASVSIGPGNRDLTLSVNGANATIQLAEGTYTAEQLAGELAGKINNEPDLSGGKVSVTVDAGRLKVTTENFGSSASLTMTSGSALADLGFTTGQAATGVNVAGSFKVNGVTEAATGAGRFLTGSSGNASTEGLQVQVTLSAAQLNADPDAPEASVTVTRGLGAVLDSVISRFVDPSNGRFRSIDNGYQKNIDDIKATIDRQNKLTEEKRESLVRRFAAMEATISRLQALGTSLGSQLTSLSSALGG